MIERLAKAEKGRFKEEGHQAFDGERCAENVADIMGVVGPVGAELKFHGNAGGHAHRKINSEQLAPKTCGIAPNLPPGHDVSAFHDCQQERQAERQRNEQKMIERRDGKLQPIEAYGIYVKHSSAP